MESTEGAQPSGLNDETQPAISKRQLKRQAKMQQREEMHKKRKLEEKEKKKQMKAAKRAETNETFANMSEEEKAARKKEHEEKAEQRRAEKAATRARLQDGFENGVKLVVDLDFHDKMTPKEQKSLIQQLSYCSSANSHAAVPCSLHLTSLKGVMKGLLDKQFPGHQSWVVGLHETSFVDAFQEAKDRTVYLTADSPNVISTLEQDYVYVIGGIVDRNRYKCLCLDRARSFGVKTACLPIGDHIKLAGSRVLTVNHVVALLLKYLEVQDWKAACEHIVPTRKQAGDDGAGDAHNTGATCEADSPTAPGHSPACIQDDAATGAVADESAKQSASQVKTET